MFRIATLITAALVCQAAITPIPNAARYTSASDLIVVGRVSTVTDGPAATISTPSTTTIGHQQLARIQIARVLKGTYSAPVLDIAYFVPDSGGGYESLQPGQFAMFFLTKTGTQLWAPVETSLFTLPAVQTAPSGSGDPVLAELAAVIASSNTPAWDRAFAVHAAGTALDNALTAAIRSAVSSPDSAVRWTAILKLLSAGDASILPTVEKTLLNPISSSDQFALMAIPLALRGQANVQSAIPVLINLLLSANAEVRHGAAWTIASIGGATAIANLPRVLSDPDIRVRYDAVYGLAMATNQSDWLTSFEGFQADEARYLNYWRAQYPGAISIQCTGCYFLSNNTRATVAFNVKMQGGSNTFSYNYRTVSQTVQFVSTSVPVIQGSGNAATFSGQGVLNAQAGYTFSVSVRDGGPAGSGQDTVSLQIAGPNGYTYSTSGAIAGGDISIR